MSYKNNHFESRRFSLWPPSALAVLGVIVILAVVAWPRFYAQAQMADNGFSSLHVVRASMAAQPENIAASGQGVVVIHLAVAAGYHIQSHHPLESFLIPASVKLLPSAGMLFGAVHYPAAITIPVPPQITRLGKLSVYEGRFDITIPFKVLPAAVAGPREITARITFQACNDQSCLMPETLRLRTLVHIANTSGGASATLTAKTPHAAPVARQPGRSAGAGHFRVGNSVVAGELGEINALHYQVSAPSEPIWRLIIFALLGGLILNVMPCVLPVIPLKVLAMVQQAHGSRPRAVLHATVFAAGIVALFLILAVAMGLYRAATGQALTYGMQYQHPWFLITIALVVLALALSMLGVWTVQPPRALAAMDTSGGGLAGAFGTGLLATILASSCSAPFLGVMLTWALVQSTWIVALFFVLIGIGMAWPYVLLAAFPAWLERIPHAGRWSELLKEALGLVMVGVAVYLLLSTDNRSQIVTGFALAVILAMVCWGWGRLPDVNMSGQRIWMIRTGCIGTGIIAGALFVTWMGGLRGVANSTATVRAGVLDARTFRLNRWQAFSLGRMQAALRAGHPVVVDFSAPWCINCKFVKATVLDAPEVRNVYARTGTVLLSADIDRPVDKALWLKLGGRALPYLAILSPHRPLSPEILRDIYTQRDVIRDLHAAVR
ncbi:MAG: thioredoxin family protein [Planctomycetia bacterium]|nr:thioredoxin family protein [Planctomycetia bacterium]